jgi:hypothetical protein
MRRLTSAQLSQASELGVWLILQKVPGHDAELFWVILPSLTAGESPSALAAHHSPFRHRLGEEHSPSDRIRTLFANAGPNQPADGAGDLRASSELVVSARDVGPARLLGWMVRGLDQFAGNGNGKGLTCGP